MEPAAPERAERLASLAPGASALRWSPDGTKLAVLVPTDLALQLGEPSSVGTHAPVVVTRLGYKADGLGLWGTSRNQPHVIDLDGRVARRVTSDDYNYTSIEWRPDSAALVAVAAGEPDADITGGSSVYEIPVNATGQTGARLLAFADGLAAYAKWLPDSSAMLVVGQLTPQIGHLHLFLVAPDGSVVQNLSGALDRTVQLADGTFAGSDPQVLGDNDGTRVFFSVNDGGVAVLCEVSLSDGQPKVILGHSEEGLVQVSARATAAGEARLAGVVKTPHSFGELVVMTAAGDRLAETDHGREYWKHRSIPTPEAREFELSSGLRVPGWVLRDPNRAEPGPLLVDIHGGPHSSWDALAVDAHWYRDVLVEAGWTVLLLNPPASQGYGEDFYRANIGTWGHGDQSAFLEPIDALVNEGLVDDQKVVVMGYSYGGYSVCWLTSQTNRFAAAIAGGVVSNAVSLASSDVAHPELFKELGGAPWQNSEQLEPQSPIRFVHNVQTPTLILHGIADDRCPVNQAEEWFTALRARGVTTEMVLYPEASHLMILSGYPSHRADYQRRIVEWATRFAG